MYKTTITNQGTISIPAALRKKYNLTAGEKLIIEDHGDLVIKKVPRFSEMRIMNQEKIKKGVVYQSGDGFATYVKEKYDAK